MKDVTLGVSEALELINQTLDEAFPFIIVEGEVSGFTVSKNKFIFFDIKDDESTIGCFMMLFKLKFPFEDGMKVRILAQPKITNWGKFSLTIHEVMPVGEGSLKKSFQILKDRLDKEGLFSPERKRQLPKFPKNIVVVSSSGAAGWADFSKIINQRWGGMNIQLADVGVQGLNAPGEIVRAIEHFNQESTLADVLVVIRGGGSADDLAAFNHEDVVRAVAGSRIPTVIGIGHETDESLAELAADLRASTPSNAAELIVPDKQDVLGRIEGQTAQITSALERYFETLDGDISNRNKDIRSSAKLLLDGLTDRLSADIRLIAQFNPESVLKRGYGILRKGQSIITSVENVKIGEIIQVDLKDGSLGVTVDEKR